MRKFRQKYYDWFSTVYDRFVAMHSADQQGMLKQYLAEQTGAGQGSRLLDICCGTGSLLEHLAKKTGDSGLVVGVDFSFGMLTVAGDKTRGSRRVFLVQADAGRLPFKTQIFDALTCAHAFYELKGDSQERALGEIARTLKPGKPFLMMEHDIPQKRFIRMLFYLRLLSMGARRALQILKYEQQVLADHFDAVEKILTPTGRSKIYVCQNLRCGAARRLPAFAGKTKRRCGYRSKP